MIVGARNEYPQGCWRCGEIVRVGEGTVSGKPGDWQIQHIACIPVADADRYLRPWIKGMEYDL